jgi:hypothetical protein
MAQPTIDHGGDAKPVELPIACTLEANEGAERLIRWKALLERSLPKVMREPDQIVVRLAGAPSVAAELDAIVAAERACCSFVKWHVVHDTSWHELQIRGTRDGLDAIAAMFHVE